MFKRTLLVFALAAGCGGAQAEAPSAPEPAAEDAAEVATPERLSLHDAIVRAVELRPEGLPIEVEVEDLEGREALEVEVLIGEQIREIYMDPTTGEVIQDEFEELDEEDKAEIAGLAEAVAAAEIDLNQAVDFALSKHDVAEILEVELEMHEGKLVLEVGLKKDGAETELIYDPVTKEFLGTEEEEKTEPAAAE